MLDEMLIAGQLQEPSKKVSLQLKIQVNCRRDRQIEYSAQWGDLAGEL